MLELLQLMGQKQSLVIYAIFLILIVLQYYVSLQPQGYFLGKIIKYIPETYRQTFAQPEMEIKARVSFQRFVLLCIIALVIFLILQIAGLYFLS